MVGGRASAAMVEVGMGWWSTTQQHRVWHTTKHSSGGKPGEKGKVGTAAAFLAVCYFSLFKEIVISTQNKKFNENLKVLKNKKNIFAK